MSRRASHVNENTVKMPSGLILGHCDICNRENTPGKDLIKLKLHGFAEPRELIEFKDGDMTVTDNPRFFQIAVCGTDFNLLTRLKKVSSNKNLTPKQLYEVTRQYRERYPIRPI